MTRVGVSIGQDRSIQDSTEKEIGKFRGKISEEKVYI